jgi:hypothetical protein
MIPEGGQAPKEGDKGHEGNGHGEEGDGACECHGERRDQRDTGRRSMAGLLSLSLQREGAQSPAPSRCSPKCSVQRAVYAPGQAEACRVVSLHTARPAQAPPRERVFERVAPRTLARSDHLPT